MPQTKRTFYPSPEVDEILSKAPPKKVSEKVNWLILKGLKWESAERTALAYEKYNQALAQETSANNKEIKRNLKMATSLFDDEDEIKEWY